MRLLRVHTIGRSYKSIILASVAGSLTLALVAAGLAIWPLWTNYRYTNEIVALDGALGGVTVDLARERGLVARALGDDSPAAEALLAEIAAARQRAETGLDEISFFLARGGVGASLKGRLQKVQLLRSHVRDLRQRADAAIRLPVSRRQTELTRAWIATATDFIESCQDMRIAARRSTLPADMTFEDLHMLQHFAWSAAEHAGRERALLAAIISSQDPIGEDDFAELQSNRGETTFAWEMAMLLAEISRNDPEVQFAARAVSSQVFVDFESLRRDVIQAGREGLPYPLDARTWFDAATGAIESFLRVEAAAAQAASEHRDRVFRRVVTGIAVGAALFVALTALAAVTLFLFKRRVSDPLRQITQITRRFAQGDYAAAIPNVLPGSDVATIAEAVGEFRNDAAERARLQAELRIARDRAETANRAKTHFLANMSHELRTPLNAIIGFSELMKNQALGPVGHDRYLEYAKDVHDSGCRLLEIVNDVLDMAQIESEQITLNEREMDVGEIVALGVRRIEPRAQSAGLRVETMWADRLQVWADPEKIDRVIANLLSNAVKFTPAGGRIAVRAYRDDLGATVIEVEDTGIGMSAAEIELAYEPFSQADGSLNRRHEGTGLGIPLSDAIARLHGGRLEISSTPGAGTTVRMVLPEHRSLD